MISVLTPTYNRAYTLERLYRSLVEQSFKDFEWIVIDDGSVDATEQLIRNFQDENLLSIVYLKQENVGKSQSINNGVKICSGYTVFIVDSDDALTIDALASIDESFTQADAAGQNISGVAFRKAYFNGVLIGEIINDGHSDIHLLTATEASHLFKGDLAYCFKKKILEACAFPRFPTEKFVPELYIWNKISDKAPIRYDTAKIIYNCDYLDDGLSVNFSSQLRANPRGFGIYYKDQLFREKSGVAKIKMLIRYTQCCFYKWVK